MLMHSNSKPIRIVGRGFVARDIEFFLRQSNLSAQAIDYEILKEDRDADRYQYLIGIADNLLLRQEIIKWLDDKKLDLCSWIHDKSEIMINQVGKGVVCYPFSLMIGDTEDHVLIGPYSLISHNAVAKFGSVLLPYSRLLGSSILGKFCQLQTGSCVLDHREINAEMVVVLPGSTVSKNITESGIYGGTPARRISS